MKTSDALRLIIDIENSFDTSSVRWRGLITWPLLRKILWFKLISIDIATSEKKKKKIQKYIWNKQIIFTIFSKKN